MSEKENAFPSVVADQEGLNVNDAFNIHEALEDVKGESPARRLLYKNPYLTAGSRGIFSLLEDKKDPLLEFDILDFILREYENLSIDKIALMLPAPAIIRHRNMIKKDDGTGFKPEPFTPGQRLSKQYWDYFDKMIQSGNPVESGLTNYYRKSVKWNGDFNIQWHIRDDRKTVGETVRIEFNPNKADLSKLSAFFSAFDIRDFSLIRITRIDIAIDYGIYINPLCWRCSKIRKTSKNEDDGKIQTYYFGSNKSDIQLRIYDKASEILDTEKLNLGHPLWRVESQINSIRGIDFFLTNKELLFEFNPFERLEFYDPFPIDTKGQGAYSLFINCARAYGLPFALSDLNKHTRKAYLKRLSEDMRNPPFNPPSLIYSNCIRPVFNAFSSRLRELFFYGRENGLEVPEN